MPVTAHHKDYVKNRPLWDLVDDCAQGSVKVKEGGTKYLPMPNPDDDGSDDRYKVYLLRASYVNFTGPTKTGLLGMVFRKDAVVELPTEIDYLVDDASGSGLSLDQMARDAIGETIEVGRYGLLTDYPSAPPGLTAAEVQALNLRANILPYKAKSVINWRVTQVGGISKLSLVVLVEPKEKIAADGFSVEEVIWHRVLLLVDGVYRQMLFDENDNALLFGDEDHLTPTKADGSTWNEIPFTFIGSQNNSPSVDKAPLLDIADVNIAHYRNSADFEESSFQVGQPTPVATGLNQSVIDSANKNGLMLGSRTAWVLNEGASAMLLQANPNQMPLEGMREKEGQMVKIGARIIMDSGGNETAEAARIRFAGSNSQLGVIVGNVQAAFLKSFEWAAEFAGGPEDAIFELNDQFYEKTIDPQLIMAGIQLLDRGVFAETDLRWNLRRAGMISGQRTDEDIRAESERADPLG